MPLEDPSASYVFPNWEKKAAVRISTLFGLTLGYTLRTMTARDTDIGGLAVIEIGHTIASTAIGIGNVIRSKTHKAEMDAKPKKAWRVSPYLKGRK